MRCTSNRPLGALARRSAGSMPRHGLAARIAPPHFDPAVGAAPRWRRCAAPIGRLWYFVRCHQPSICWRRRPSRSAASPAGRCFDSVDATRPSSATHAMIAEPCRCRGRRRRTGFGAMPLFRRRHQRRAVPRARTMLRLLWPGRSRDAPGRRTGRCAARVARSALELAAQITLELIEADDRADRSRLRSSPRRARHQLEDRPQRLWRLGNRAE